MACRISFLAAQCLLMILECTLVFWRLVGVHPQAQIFWCSFCQGFVNTLVHIIYGQTGLRMKCPTTISFLIFFSLWLVRQPYSKWDHSTFGGCPYTPRNNGYWMCSSAELTLRKSPSMLAALTHNIQPSLQPCSMPDHLSGVTWTETPADKLTKFWVFFLFIIFLINGKSSC